MSLRVLMTLCSAFFLISCGSDNSNFSDTLIVGGDRVSMSDPIAKSTVALVSPAGRTFCTGTLISSKFVLTASHCLASYSEKKLYIAFGLIAREGHFSKERLRKAARFTLHDKFSQSAMRSSDPTPPNDIALVELEAAAPSPFKAVPVMRASDKVRVGETLTLAGFGITAWGNSDTGELLKVETPLDSVNAEKKEFDFGPTPGQTACKGDSGGPAYVYRSGRIKLLGVTSRGNYCKSSGTYTDVRRFIGWINEAASR